MRFSLQDYVKWTLQELRSRGNQIEVGAVTKLLLTGNATCANRGDSAIFRGLINEIQSSAPDTELISCSRHPVSSSVVLQRQLEPDWIYQSQLTSGSTFKKAIGLVGKKWGHRKLLWKKAGKTLGRIVSLPRATKSFIDRLQDIDAIIHVGGSFFVDLYGVQQFDVVMASAFAKKPVYLMGHSMGPFQLPLVKKVAQAYLPTVKKIFIREQASLSELNGLNCPLKNVRAGSDTAWLMPEASNSSVFDAEIGDCNEPLVAVTARKLAPFEKRLGISQEEYEQNIATLLNEIICSGNHIVGVSMCTGLGGYAHDDRLVVESIRQRLDDPNQMTVLWNEYNDVEIGGILQRCRLLVGTRLHSAILALRYGTPALALYYEHKSEGVLRQLGLPDWSIRLQEIATPETIHLAKGILQNQSDVREKVAKAVSAEQAKARSMVREVLDDILTGVRV